MNEYIERNAFLEHIVGVTDGWRKPFGACYEDEIKKFPSADVVEVVRCKDCKHYWKNYPSDDVPMCIASPRDDAFCSEGERREDAETN